MDFVKKYFLDDSDMNNLQTPLLIAGNGADVSEEIKTKFYSENFKTLLGSHI